MDAILAQKSPLISKLESIAKLTDEERQALLLLPVQEEEIAASQDIVREGESPSRSFYIRSGLTCGYKTTLSGKRQITAIHIPGDAPDLQSLHLDTLDISIATLATSRVVFMRHDDVRALCRQHPRIADVLWRETLIDAAIYREWLTSMGQHEGVARVAHFLCEMLLRHKAVGLAQDVDGNPSINWSLTQTQLADALGLSSVHVNRSLQALREMGLLYWKGGILTALDWQGLTTAGEFDPAYLNLR